MALDTTSPPAGADEKPISQAGPVAPVNAPQLAEVDLLIERADLGPGRYTIIAAVIRSHGTWPGCLAGRTCPA